MWQVLLAREPEDELHALVLEALDDEPSDVGAWSHTGSQRPETAGRAS